VLEASQVTKIYGTNKKTAFKMMADGGDKDSVRKQTGATVALWDVSFQVKRGKIFVVIGLSGSGKSTILRCFNQLIRPTSGHVLYCGRDINGMNRRELLEYRRNNISMVFQHFGLFTHRTVMDNVTYGLEVRGIPKKEREERAAELIKMVGLDGWERKSIRSLSGGMKQRVGIARALANDPEVLLMDEPFSALDPIVRRDMQSELISIQKKLSKTTLFITHDINEAFRLGGEVAVMKDGKVIQIGTPEEISTSPADEYVRRFTEGADKSQVLTAKYVMADPACTVKEEDEPADVIRKMRIADSSYAYVVDEDARLKGILLFDDALKAYQSELPMTGFVDNELITSSEDVLLCDIMPIAASTNHPIAIVDRRGHLKGVITKASVIASLI
jgi:glycine betaine/proline transport system ATP-binding protein